MALKTEVDIIIFIYNLLALLLIWVFLRTITGELLDSALCYSIEIKANRKILMALVAYDNSDTSEYEDDENEGQSTRLLKENSVTIGWFSISLNLVICL